MTADKNDIRMTEVEAIAVCLKIIVKKQKREREMFD